ncbi:hypothetical protein M3Y96_01072500 [Aphelenchoides besseyi]|nr:hypothetical protein M3Y96_01072500 [Aphelenchoides besseyi]
MATSRSKYFNFFHISDGRATCTTCGSDFPYSSRIGTNSLRNHIRNKHVDLFDQLAVGSTTKTTNRHVSERNESTDIERFVKIEPSLNNNNEEETSDRLKRKRRSSTDLPYEPNEIPPISTTRPSIESITALALASEQHYARQLANCMAIPTRTELPLNIAEFSDTFFPPSLLDVMATTRPNDLDQTARSDIEVIAKNLSCIADATFYLRTTSEIVKKWPTANVRIFLQDLLKKAMEEDNKLLNSA